MTSEATHSVAVSAQTTGGHSEMKSPSVPVVASICLSKPWNPWEARNLALESIAHPAALWDTDSGPS
jgi:hypothetical protein